MRANPRLHAKPFSKLSLHCPRQSWLDRSAPALHSPSKGCPTQIKRRPAWFELSTCLLFALYAGVFTTLCVASILLGESTLWLQGRLSRYAAKAHNAGVFTTLC